jgi:hypothetical protein
MPSTPERRREIHNTPAFKAKKKAYREKNKDAIAKYNSEYQKVYKDKPGVKEAARKRAAEYRLSNPGRVAAALKRCKKNRYATDGLYRAAESLRCRLNNCLRGRVKKSSAVRDLGCSIVELRSHLESLFQPGMNWDNWGSGPGKWQIDHIFPLSAVNIADAIEQRAACNWRNLQPLWFEDNIAKGDSVSAKAQHLFIMLKECVALAKQ